MKATTYVLLVVLTLSILINARQNTELQKLKYEKSWVEMEASYPEMDKKCNQDCVKIVLGEVVKVLYSDSLKTNRIYIKKATTKIKVIK